MPRPTPTTIAFQGRAWPPPKPAISLADQIRSLKKELAVRRSVYPRWIHDRRMSEKTARYEISCVECAIQSLEAIVSFCAWADSHDQPAPAELSSPLQTTEASLVEGKPEVSKL